MHHPLPDTEPLAWRRRGPLLWLAAAAIALVLAGAAAMMWRRQLAPTMANPVPALTVTFASPKPVTWPSTFDASGPIASWQEASIGTQVGGYQLVDVRVNVGDHVRKGQVLARLDPALLRADEVQLEAAYQQAAANQKRALGLKSSGGISDQDILQYVTQAKTAAAQLAAKRLQLRYTAVIAPDDGTISARIATLGAVTPVGQELFRLVRQDRLEWRGQLTAPQLTQVRVGQHVVVTLPDGSGASARVRETAPVLDPQMRLGIVYADIVPGSHARAGMYADGKVVTGLSDGLAVPAESVVLRDGRSYVLKLLDRSAMPRVAQVPVTVGRHNGTDVEILSGLANRDRVVVRGAGFVNDGDLVRLSTDLTPATASSQESAP